MDEYGTYCDYEEDPSLGTRNALHPPVGDVWAEYIKECNVRDESKIQRSEDKPGQGKVTVQSLQSSVNTFEHV